MNPDDMPQATPPPLDPRNPQHFELLRIAQDIHTAIMLIGNTDLTGTPLGDDGRDYLIAALSLSRDMNDLDYRDDMISMLTRRELLGFYATDGICSALSPFARNPQD